MQDAVEVVVLVVAVVLVLTAVTLSLRRDEARGRRVDPVLLATALAVLLLAAIAWTRLD